MLHPLPEPKLAIVSWNRPLNEQSIAESNGSAWVGLNLAACAGLAHDLPRAYCHLVQTGILIHALTVQSGVYSQMDTGSS
jgi:hypothetical protein